MSYKVQAATGHTADPLAGIQAAIANITNVTDNAMAREEARADRQLAREDRLTAEAESNRRFDAVEQRNARLDARQLDRDQKADAQQLIANELARETAKRQADEQSRLEKAARQVSEVHEGKQQANKLAEDVYAGYLTEAGNQASIDVRNNLATRGTNVNGTNIWEPVVVGKDTDGKDVLVLRPEAQKVVDTLIRSTDTAGERLDMALGSIEQDTAKNDLTSRLMKAANTDAITAAAAMAPYTDKFVDKAALLSARDKNMEFYNKQIDNTTNALQALGNGRTKVDKNGNLTVTTGEGEDKEILHAPEKSVDLSDITERFNKGSNTGNWSLLPTDKEGVNFAQSFNDAKADLVKSGYSDTEIARALTNSLAEEYRAGRQGGLRWYEDPSGLKTLLVNNIESNRAYDKALIASKASPTSGQKAVLTEKLADLSKKMETLQSTPLYTPKAELLSDRLAALLNNEVLGEQHVANMQRLNSAK